MPLVVMCGPPCCGKSALMQQLQAHLENVEKCRTHLITDYTCGIDFSRRTTFADPTEEKKLRGLLKSEVQRHLNSDVTVLLDSMNYIKSFRYELFCLVKSMKTTQCLVFCEAQESTCIQWDAQRTQDSPDLSYGAALIQALFLRFERPNPNNRWDSPLFYVCQDDPESVANFSLAAVSDALLRGKALIPNQSTVSQPLSSGDYLQELDRMTQRVVQHLLADQGTATPGSFITFASENSRSQTTKPCQFMFKRPLTLAELQRHRRQFITLSRTRPDEDMDKSQYMFVQYLQNALA